jgi:hypothetical protein
MLDVDMSKLALIFLTFQRTCGEGAIENYLRSIKGVKACRNFNFKRAENWTHDRMLKMLHAICKFAEVGNSLLFASLGENLNKLGNVCILVMLQFWALVV